MLRERHDTGDEPDRGFFFFFNWDIIAYNIVFVSAVHSVNKL